MSIWTHVAGIARIDWLRPLGGEIDFEKIFGKEVTFDDLWNHRYSVSEGIETLPMGSEGTLHMSVWKNPKENCLACYIISIFGDLRDYDTPEKIIEWFKEKLKIVGMVRQATITAECSFGKSLKWTYERGDEDEDS